MALSAIPVSRKDHFSLGKTSIKKRTKTPYTRVLEICRRPQSQASYGYSPDLGSSRQAWFWFWFLYWHLLHFLLTDDFMFINVGHISSCLLAHHYISWNWLPQDHALPSICCAAQKPVVPRNSLNVVWRFGHASSTALDRPSLAAGGLIQLTSTQLKSFPTLCTPQQCCHIQTGCWEQSLAQHLRVPETCSGAVWESASWHRPKIVGVLTNRLGWSQASA